MTRSRRTDWGLSHNETVRQNVLAILHESWPQPWSGGQLRRAFSPRHYARVGVALNDLRRRGQAIEFPEHYPWAWWTDASFGRPRCWCGAEAWRVVYLPAGTTGSASGGYVCRKREHLTETFGHAWAWPYAQALESTLAQPN